MREMVTKMARTELKGAERFIPGMKVSNPLDRYLAQQAGLVKGEPVVLTEAESESLRQLRIRAQAVKSHRNR